MKLQPEFGEVYEAHHSRVLSLCRYLLKSPEAAEDATHEVFVKVQKKFSSYDPSHSLSSWILKIASNHCMDVLRRQSTERRIFGWASAGAAEPPSDGPGPLKQLLDNEQGLRVRAGLDALPDKYRWPLVLIYYNDFSYEEAAEVLGVGRNTVATLIYRGKQLLRRSLTAEGVSV